MKNNKTLSVLLCAIWIVQLLIEIVTFGIIWKLDMLPGLYLAVVAVLLVLLWLLIGGLLFVGRKHGTGRRVIALLLVALSALGCAGASGAAAHLGQTVGNITGKTEITTVMAVYVRTDDPAQVIMDASGYTFAVFENIGVEKTEQAIAALEKKCDTTLATMEYENVVKMVDALLNGEADAILMSAAYAETLEDMDEYYDFSSKTRVLHKLTIVDQSNGTKVPPATEEPLTTRPAVGEGVGNTGSDTPAAAAITQAPFVLYLSGNDTRSTALVTGRSDVNILAVVNPVTKQILLVNTPRDYFIPHPLAPDGQRDKLTHLGNDGIDCSMRGLEALYNERIDFYAQINFTGFETLIDAIGGITVTFDRGFTALGITEIYAGENYLTGEQALHVARDRYSFSDGDLARGRNQMKIIKAVVQKLASGAILTNYAEILDSLEGMFATDITMGDVSKLVKMQLKDLATWNVQTYAVTGTGGEGKTYTNGDASVIFPDQGSVDFGQDLIDRVIAGDILTEEDVVYPG